MVKSFQFLLYRTLYYVIAAVLHFMKFLHEKQVFETMIVEHGVITTIRACLFTIIEGGVHTHTHTHTHTHIHTHTHTHTYTHKHTHTYTHTYIYIYKIYYVKIVRLIFVTRPRF